MAHIRKCLVCGEEYKYCPRCAQYSHLPKWMFVYHDENCKKIDYVISSFGNGHITAEEARKDLEVLDLTNASNFVGDAKILLDKINEEIVEKKPRRKKFVNDDLETE